MRDRKPKRDVLSKRDVLKATAALGGVCLAGCLGDEDDAPGSMAEFDEFDPTDPHGTLPQLASTLFEHNFDVGTAEVFEQMERRTEARYGMDPRETPADEDELIDPDPLVYSFVPVEEPAVYEEAFDPVIENIAAETGRDVEYAASGSYAAQVEAMRAERVHAGGFSTGATAFATNLAGAVPFGMQSLAAGVGYRLWLLARTDNDEIHVLEDLAGKTVGHVDPGSNSGHQAPVALFSNEGVVPDEDYDVEFTGAHDNSILGVLQGDYDAAPVASVIATRMAEAEHIDADELKVIWMSDPFPAAGYAYRYNLLPEVQEGIVRAHLDYDYSGTALEEHWGEGFEFLEIDYATHWDVILQIHESTGVDYRVEDL